MINFTMNSQGAIDSNSLLSINTVTCDVVQAQNIESLNTRKRPSAAAQERPAAASGSQFGSGASQSPAAPGASNRTSGAPQPQPGPPSPPPRLEPGSDASPSHPQPRPVPRPLPALRHMVQKGQKTTLQGAAPLRTLKACLGWNTTNSQCDVDVSAFLLDDSGQVPGDSWFVFYGQPESPEHSTRFSTEASGDRESITIRLDKLNPAVKKIVFVLTINEALEKRLHFGMIQDAYVRILNADNQEELVSFKMTEYYTNVISMMIGEIYQRNGVWKFNAVGNGIAKDLAGLCALYGVQVND